MAPLFGKRGVGGDGAQESRGERYIDALEEL
jgi:hypothetical protein